MRPYLALLAVVLVPACSTATATLPQRGVAPTRHPATPPAARARVDVSVQAHRVESALRLDVRGTAHEAIEGDTVEDPARWTIQASVAGQPLKRLVNGSVRVEREPAAPTGDLWDTTVMFTVVFQLPADADHVEVHIAPPGADAVTQHLPLPSRGEGGGEGET